MVQDKDTVLVTGAPGFVGSYVVKELLDEGSDVRALIRKTSSLAQLAERLGISESELSSFPGLTLFEGDITDAESLKAPTEGVDYVIHIAALFREAKHPPEVYRKVNITGTENVLRAAKDAGVKRVVHCSTVGVHSHIQHPPADETEAYRPGDIYQETKCEGEKIALDWFKNKGLEGVVIRPAMIWGPGDARTLKLFRGVAKGRFPMIGWGNTYLHWVSVIDLAKSFRLALTSAVPSGEVFIIAGKEHIALKTLIGKIADHLGVSAPKLRIPALPVQIMGSICEALCIPFGIEPPLHRRRVDFFTKTRSFNITKAQRLLSYEPRGGIDDEIREIVDWYQEHDWQAAFS